MCLGLPVLPALIKFAVYVKDISVWLKCGGSVNPTHSPRNAHISPLRNAN